MIEAMPIDLPQYVVMQRTRHGKVVFYFRKGKGKRTRLPGSPASAEFKSAYDAALVENARQRAHEPEIKAVPQQSLAWLIERHKESGYWFEQSPATQRQRTNIFKGVVDKAGAKPFAAIDQAAIQRSMDARRETPAQANVFLKAMRALFKWAVKAGYVQTDPTIGVEWINYKTEGFATWTDDDAALFCATWKVGTMERLAFELAALSGLRKSDLHRAGRQHMRGNQFSIKTQKTGAVVTVEFPDDLMTVIEETPSGGLYFVVGKNGRPYRANSFGNWFRKAAQAAGVNKPLHGVRKYAASAAAEGGATDRELMAQFGWATPKQASTYTKEADKVRMGIAASRKIAERKKNK